ncbi:MAG: hypothetical protein LBL23_05575 [Coriobacteriales bacterium]|nr:hypothetical protein [Coriobacteriales bacterium]
MINTGTDHLDVRLSAAPFSLKDGNYDDLDTQTETPQTQLSRWISFDAEQITVPAAQQITVGYNVAVPLDIPDGGQYATIFAEEASPRGGTVKLLNKVGMLVYAHPQGQTREDLRVVASDMGGFWHWAGPVVTTAAIENAGNVDSELEASLVVTDKLSGTIVYESPDDTVTLLPETSYELTLAWDDVPSWGMFELTQSVSGPGVAHSQSATILVLPLWAVVVLAAIVILIVVQVRYFRSIKRQRQRQGKHDAESEENDE